MRIEFVFLQRLEALQAMPYLLEFLAAELDSRVLKEHCWVLHLRLQRDHREDVQRGSEVFPN